MEHNLSSRSSDIVCLGVSKPILSTTPPEWNEIKKRNRRRPSNPSSDIKIIGVTKLIPFNSSPPPLDLRKLRDSDPLKRLYFDQFLPHVLPLPISPRASQDSPSLNQNLDDSDQKHQTVTCFACRGMGHYATTCPMLINRRKKYKRVKTDQKSRRSI